MASSPRGRGEEPINDVRFGDRRRPEPLMDLQGALPAPAQRNQSNRPVSSQDFLSPTLPSLPYSRPTPRPRNTSSGETGTEYNPPARSSLYGNSRVRNHYVSLEHALSDTTQPDFSPEQLYAAGGNNNPNSPTDKTDSTGLGPGGRHSFAYETYPPTPYSALKTGEADFLDTPSPSLFPRGIPKPPKRHPFSPWFEAPKWKSLLVHTGLCLAAYPFLLIFVIIAKGRSLFWTRVIVGIGCGIAGMLLGLNLIRLARSHIEAAAWATVIHQSKFHDQPGVRLRDIAPHAADPVSAYTGFGLLWNRHLYPGTARRNRAHYDTRPWSIHIIFFLILIGLSGMLPFLFGRLVNIATEVKSQREEYHEAAIKGDISDADLERAANLSKTFDDYKITWSISPFSSHGSLPPVVEMPWYSDRNTSMPDTVYFSETIKSQLKSNGSGFGNFETQVLLPSFESQNSSSSVTALQEGLSPGTVVRQPRWGIRIKCEKIPDAHNNILPMSRNLSQTYVFTPKDTVRGLLDYFQKPYPTNFTPAALQPNDQDWPANVDQSATMLAANFYHNGVNHAYYSRPLFGMGNDDTGFVSLEIVLIRLNTSFAPRATFPIFGDPILNENGTATYIGYDAAVCIEVFEPWIVDVYNGTAGAPTTLGIVEKKNIVDDFDKGGRKEEREGPKISDPNVRRALTSKRIRSVYVVAHQNGVNQMLKDNGRDSFYVPSTLAISYTDGTGGGAYGYTTLSASRFENVKALSDASNILPYFAGSGSLVARTYPDRVTAYAYIDPVPMVFTLFALFALGTVAALFVPRLPLNVPKRGFELYSWVAAFYADELVGIGKGGDTPESQLLGAPGQMGLPIGKRMELEEIEQHLGDVRFRYVS